MDRTKAIAIALSLLSAVIMLAGVGSSVLAQQTVQQGVFGTIVALDDQGTGLTLLTVKDSRGENLEIEVLDEITIVSIPGRGSYSARDFVVGDIIAAVVLVRLDAVNLNTESVEALEIKLPQISPIRAQAIVDYRVANGPFLSVEDVDDVPGIGSAVLKAIRPLIVVNDRSKALEMLVKPSNPTFSSHFTGVVIERRSGQITLLDGKGNRVELNFPDGLGSVVVGTVVVAPTKFDPRLDTLSVRGIETSQIALTRLSKVLRESQNVGAIDNVKNLKERLLESTSGELTILSKVAELAQPGILPGIELALENARRTLSKFGLSGPFLTQTGVVDLLDMENGIIGLTLPKLLRCHMDGGDALELTVEATTVILAEGKPRSLREDLFGSSLTVTYDTATCTAATIEILSAQTLEEELMPFLIPWATVGELDGVITELDIHVNPPQLTVMRIGGGSTTLSIPEDARIDLGDGALSPDARLLGLQAHVQFDPGLMTVTQIQPLILRSAERFISGVIKAVARKEAREVTIMTSEGETLTLTVTGDTVLKNDGAQIPINEVMIGDLVRPSTRYNNDTLVLGQLDLKAPILNVTGLIRGKETTTEEGRLTVSVPGHGLITLQVGEDIEIIRLGEKIDLASVEVGERLAVSSTYNAVTLDAIRLMVTYPMTSQIRGTVANLDPTSFILLIAVPDAESLALLVPNKPGVVTKDGDTRASFLDLKISDSVEITYRPEDRIVVNLVAVSP